MRYYTIWRWQEATKGVIHIKALPFGQTAPKGAEKIKTVKALSPEHALSL